MLAAARDACDGKVIAIAQPHRYSRLHDLFDDFAGCFNDADCLAIVPVYEAGEQPIEGANAEALVSAIRAGGHRDARYLEGKDAIAPFVRDVAEEGDFVLMLGAGSISLWANSLPEELAEGNQA